MCWLSLEKVIQHVLQQWPAIHGYFELLSETNHSSRLVQLIQHFKSHSTRLISFTLDSLCKFNVTLQLSLPLLPALKTEVKQLLKILMGQFLKCEVVREPGDDLADIHLTVQSLQL